MQYAVEYTEAGGEIYHAFCCRDSRLNWLMQKREKRARVGAREPGLRRALWHGVVAEHFDPNEPDLTRSNTPTAIKRVNSTVTLSLA